MRTFTYSALRQTTRWAAIWFGLGFAAPALADPPNVIVVQGNIEKGPTVVEIDAEGAPENGVFGFSRAILASPAGKYWIGAHVEPIDDVVRSHLKLKSGLVVRFVAPESPAAKAKLKPNDILLRYGETELADQVKLIEAIDKNETKAIDVTILREGQESTVKIEAAVRPQPAIKAFPRGAPEMPGEVKQWFRSLEGGAGGGGLRGFFMRPGVLIDDGQTEMPADLKVAISKQGKEPAKVSVKRGEKSWETTSDKLDVLPDDVRPHVQRLLGLPAPFNIELAAPHLQWAPGVLAPAPGGAPNFDRRFQELRSLIDELEQQIHSQSPHPGQQGPDAGTRIRDRIREKRLPREESKEPKQNEEKKEVPQADAENKI